MHVFSIVVLEASHWWPCAARVMWALNRATKLPSFASLPSSTSALSNDRAVDMRQCTQMCCNSAITKTEHEIDLPTKAIQTATATDAHTNIELKVRKAGLYSALTSQRKAK